MVNIASMAKDTDERILEIAREHFVQKGFAATRMQEIADEANINKAMLHYYFRSKDKLYREVVSHTMASVVPRFSEAMEFQGPFWEKVDLIISKYITVLLDEPAFPFFIMSELSQKKNVLVDEMRKQTNFMPSLQAFLGQMMMEMQQGSIRQINPIQLMLSIMGLTVFPFIAKPIFINVMNVADDSFSKLMEERKQIVMDFLRGALEVK